ncbi:hypothetical protein M3Y98_00822100 [Aphelenchoides besseyi]|nr:hypothetical protein M3Y98_00822100 [Aphelenchoides besseyi]KAI6195337.1 hypothetical protein M3Y96_01220400 [Aphelenchoides besseyi]
MGLSKEDIEQQLKALEDEQGKHIKEKNLDALVACYHPHATLIRKDVKASYGRDEIRDHLGPFMQIDAEFKSTPIYSTATKDGNYLIRRLTYTLGDNSKANNVEQIYKKEGDRYLIYHDEYEL